MLSLSGSFLDPLIDAVTNRAVSTATASAKPLLDDVERRVKSAILPVIALTAGSFVISLIALKRSRCKIP